jgi:hypothetical protein
MDRRISVVAGAKKENTAIQIVHAADGAVGRVGREGERAGDDLHRAGPEACEREKVIAADDARQPPEDIRDDPEVRRGRRLMRVEGPFVVARPGRHDQRAVRPEHTRQRLDKPYRPALHGLDRSERGVHQHYFAGSDADRAKLRR